jgi:hypothetical protein
MEELALNGLSSGFITGVESGIMAGESDEADTI